MVQFFGFLFFLITALSGFWCLVYLLLYILPLWIPAYLNNARKERKGIITAEDPRPTLPNQEGYSVIYSR